MQVDTQVLWHVFEQEKQLIEEMEEEYGQMKELENRLPVKLQEAVACMNREIRKLQQMCQVMERIAEAYEVAERRNIRLHEEGFTRCRRITVDKIEVSDIQDLLNQWNLLSWQQTELGGMK